MTTPPQAPAKAADVAISPRDRRAALTLALSRNALFTPSLAKACELLVRTQAADGDWAVQEGMYGVFNQTCGVTYTAYRNVFPVWALARAAQRVKQP